MKLLSPQTALPRMQLLYAAILILWLAGIGSAGTWIADFRDAFYMAMFAFFISGILHVYLICQWFSKFFTNRLIKAIGFTLLISMAAALLIVFLYHLTVQKLMMGLGIASGLIAFIFPVIVTGVYQNYLLIPSRNYKRWYYPVGQSLPDMDLLDLSSVLVIQFEFNKRADETAFTNFRAKAPGAMLFGELFFIFLNDYNDRNPGSAVEYLAPDGSAYGWLFYKKSPWYQKRNYMDPDLTFKANGIVDNETIVAVRG